MNDPALPPPGHAATARFDAPAADFEALRAGPVHAQIDEFGVTPKLINTVFEGSGLFGGEDAIAGWEFRRPAEEWLADNYFHGGEHDDWVARLDMLLDRRAAGERPLRMRTHNLSGGALRRAFERKRMLGEHDRSLAGGAAMAVAIPTRWVVRRARRVRAMLTARRMSAAGA